MEAVTPQVDSLGALEEDAQPRCFMPRQGSGGKPPPPLLPYAKERIDASAAVLPLSVKEDTIEVSTSLTEGTIVTGATFSSGEFLV